MCILHGTIGISKLIVFLVSLVALFHKRLEVFVFLCDLEYFTLELGNEQVLCITGLMDGVVTHSSNR